MPAPAHCEDCYVLTIQCPDAVGIVAAVSTFLAEHQAFITESAHYGDPDTGRFFMRTVFRSATTDLLSQDDMAAGFSALAKRFDMSWDLFGSQEKIKAVIAVSKFGHCLNDLLHRVQIGGIPVEVTGVVSNHDTFRDLVEWHEIPFHHLPMTPETKIAQEEKLLDVMTSTKAEVLALARYMQILSPDLCAKLPGRIINIHHSFLPGFKGARPYHQAHTRGVKIIGATAHYVTPDLDEGPIIEQAVERVDHTLSPEDLVLLGQDIESSVLSRAVRWHAERRVLLNGTKTVVFR
ncbi:MAG: formyltetrahydrofolate deformylase [Alphaproteobacteria bacterium]|nr:formyltetrahydrofolate deformylase [Alphaproteobacteria bacterium]